tara:strand:- start:101 stop:670 length:570 start_codon:yes stop_codon:yes gene_type:complete
MLKFLEIPKNAHDSLFFIQDFFAVPEDVDVLVLREPLKRFWSACKTNTAELSPFGNFPSFSREDFANRPTTYSGLSLTVQQAIDAIKTRLDNDDLTDHLRTQTSYIGDKRFDHVIKVESLRDDIDALLEQYEQPSITDEMWPHTHSSVKDWDDAAMAIINADDDIRAFYQADIDLYASDYSSLLKSNGE